MEGRLGAARSAAGRLGVFVVGELEARGGLIPSDLNEDGALITGNDIANNTYLQLCLRLSIGRVTLPTRKQQHAWSATKW